MRPEKETVQSPTQYFLTELGLNLEWQNSILHFGNDEPSNDIFRASDFGLTRTSNNIRTYPHIIIPASEERPIDLSPSTSELLPPSQLESKCPYNCSSSSAWSVVLEGFQQALPKEELTKPEVVENVLDVLKKHNDCKDIIRQLKEEIDRLEKKVFELEGRLKSDDKEVIIIDRDE